MARVFVVDDCKTVLAGVRVALERAGHEVRCASLAAAVPGEVRDWRPDVVLLDLQLDGVSGLDVGRTVVALGVPVCVFSSAPRVILARAAEEIGAVAFLEKGRPLTELQHLVARVTQGDRRARALGHQGPPSSRRGG